MSRVSKNIVYNVIGQLFTMILGFVAVKYIFGDLGADALGIIYFTTLLNGLLRMALDMGITSTTMREVSTNYKEEPEYICDLIKTGSLFYWGAFLFFAVLIYLFAPFIVNNWINLTSMDAQTATYVLRVLGIGSLFALPQSLYVSLFKGLQRMEYNNFTNVIVSILRQFGTIFLLFIGGNVFHIIYLYLFIYILQISI